MNKLPLPAIETERLLLRAFAPADADDVFRACSNPVLGHDAGWPPHATLDDSLFYINEIAPLGYVWAIVEKPDSRVIGSIGLLGDPRTPDDAETMMLGYWLAQDRWNCGFTTEAAKAVLDWAFMQAGITRITASHFPFNEASRHVILKCGFVPRELGEWIDDDAPAPAEPELVQWYELVSPMKDLLALADADYADFQAKLTPNIPRSQFVGVRVPVLRKFAKSYAKTSRAEAFLEQLPHANYDENMLHGLLISQMKDYDACVDALDAFLPYVDNWAVCDIMSPKALGKSKDRLLSDIRRWSASEHPYTCRFGLEMLMTFFLDDDFQPELLEIPARVSDRIRRSQQPASVQAGSEDYYVRMMVAWFFATALAKQWDATVPFLEQHRLDDWTHRKTIQKACESYRITADQKAYLKSLKNQRPQDSSDIHCEGTSAPASSAAPVASPADSAAPCVPVCGSSFFQNKACEFFPCHQGIPEELFNCLLCYCPLYALGPNCGGAFSYTEKGVKDCSACTLPHCSTDGVARVKRMYSQIADLASQ